MRTKLLASALLFMAFGAFGQLYPFFQNYDPDADLSATDKHCSDVPFFYSKFLLAIEYEFEVESETYYKFRTEHYRVKLLTDVAIEQFNKVFIPSEQVYDLKNLRAVIIRNNTRIEVPPKIEQFQGDDPSQSHYYFPISGLQVGDELDIMFTLKMEVAYDGDQFQFQGEIPIYDMDFIFIAPNDSWFHFLPYNGLPEPGRVDTILHRNQWEIHLDSVPKIEAEYFSEYNNVVMKLDCSLKGEGMPGADNYSPYEKYAEYYNLLFNSREKKSALKEVAGLAASLGLEGKTEIEKIRIIENFMKTEFSVTQQAESLTLEEMARQKKGSGPGTVHMFMELFKSQGIEYSFGFISDRYNTQFNPEIESVFFMQNYIFHFPKIDLYLAPLDFSSRLGYINYQWVPNHALLYTQYENPYPITTKIVKPVPQVNAANNFDSTVIRIVINDAMDDAEVHIERHLFGYDAGEYQTSYPLMNHSRKEEAHSELLNVFKDQSVYLLTEIQNVDFSDAFYKPIIVKGKITHLNTPLLEIAGKKHIFKLGNVFGDYLDVNELSDKKSDFVFGNAFTLNTTIIVEFPREIKMGNEFSVPVSADITGNEDILIQTTLTHKGNTIVFTKREQYRRHRYTSHEKEQVLDAFRFYNQLAKSALIIE